MIPAFDPESKSLVKKHLTEDLAKALAPLKTQSGFTLDKAVASGVKNPDSSVGLYAGDAESYTRFERLFAPVICDYHKISESTVHTSNLGGVSLPRLDPDGRFIRSTRIRVARNLAGFNFPCHMTLADRRELENRVLDALDFLPEPLQGDYISLEQENPAVKAQHQADGFIFPKGDRFQDAAGFNTDFPCSRGVFLSRDRQFRVWVNEEDHLRIMSIELSSDITGVFNRLRMGLDALKTKLDFAWSDRYGYLGSCPTNIGTAMRAGVHIRLKRLEKHPDILNRIVADHHLQIRGTSGEKTRVNDAVFDISNRRRLGISESEIILNLHTGIEAIIQQETALSP